MCRCVYILLPVCATAATLTDFFRQCGELIDVLARVLAAGHAEAELKVKALEQLITEVVSLNHAEVVDGGVAHCKLHPAAIRVISETNI